ncbi:acetyltransferase [Paenibacillus cremeus]|uniref:Acetyltransferase n=1 Tax=Paenibacillus cremeus TaxID=2163881 RepID=A0A559K0J8_9BACL|nr:acetyltransferase [Paenibacillus cremeus]TVY05651.1 acetyltransferase [Paenibacillus cremeus]
MELVIIGAGGHSKVIQDMIHCVSDLCEIRAILDDKYDVLSSVHGIYEGPIASANYLHSVNSNLKFVIAIGNNRIRRLLAKKLGLPDDAYISLIHPTAVVSPSARIGSGTVVMPNAVINADAIIGRHAIINTGAIVEHDNAIGDYVHVAPHATLTGSVTAEEGSMIGAGATVIPGRTIGEWAIIGAGASVINNISPQSTAVGTPAVIIKTASNEAETEASKSA